MILNSDWNNTLHDGILGKMLKSPQNLKLNNLAISNGANQDIIHNDIVLELKPSASAFDGSFANNGWMQEIPNPVSKSHGIMPHE